MKIALAAALISAVATLPASANEWGALSSNEAGNPVRISATGENGLGVILVCDAIGKLTAALATEDVDIDHALRNVPPVSKNKTANLTVGDKTTSNIGLVHWSSRKVLITRKHSAGAKIFNGVVRGDTITVQLTRGDELNYSLPKVNTVFGDFAKTCTENRNG